MKVLYNAKGVAEPWNVRPGSVASRRIFRTWSLFINVRPMGFEISKITAGMVSDKSTEGGGGESKTSEGNENRDWLDVLVSNDTCQGSPSGTVPEAFNTETLSSEGSEEGANGVERKRMRRKSPCGNPRRGVCD